MNRKILVTGIWFLLLLCGITMQAQTIEQTAAIQAIQGATNITALQSLHAELQAKFVADSIAIAEWCQQNGVLRKQVTPDGKVLEIVGIKNGIPVYRTTHNTNAAKTISTNKVQYGGVSGLNLRGQNIVIGQWDGGHVWRLHSNFTNNRVTIQDGYPSYNQHATHVAGTMIGSNAGNANGMADQAKIDSYTYENDDAEMAAAASANIPLLLSNHSYGQVCGWQLLDTSWRWYGSYPGGADDNFGKYSAYSRTWDSIATLAPYYTIVNSAGNDRGEGPAPFTYHHYLSSTGWVASTAFHPKDGEIDGWRTVAHESVAKNIITIGAVDDIVQGYYDTSDVKQINTSFSSFGPTTDGRIKPDLVANGDNLLSATYQEGSASSNYTTMSGTSMSAPNVTGSIALLLQHYYNTHGSLYPRAATVKSLLIHTADEAGSTAGPDFKYGWGLVNTYKAAQAISLDQTKPTTIQELSLSNGQIYETTVTCNGSEPLKVTIAWTDRTPSNMVSGPILVNDLDVRVSKDGQTFYPWVLNGNLPANAATTGDNVKDNVEQVFIPAPTLGVYTIRVSHKGGLTYPQAYSMIITGTGDLNVSFYLKQVDAGGTSFGNAEYWNNGWQQANPAQQITMQYGQQKFKASQDFKPGTYQKFSYWDKGQLEGIQYRNWDSIFIKMNTSNIIATFQNSHQVKITNVFEGSHTFTNNVSDSVFLKDPWLPDNNVALYGLQNRADQAVFKAYSSPYEASYTGQNKGVFLNRSFVTYPTTSYSISVQNNQLISNNTTGITQRAYFQNWTVSPSNGAELQNPNNPETKVNFLMEGVHISANYKATQLSSAAGAFGNNNQKKLIAAANGSGWHIYQAYESMNKIWLEYAYPPTETMDWSLGNSAMPLNDYEAKSPSMDNYEENAAVVFQERASATSSASRLRIRLFYTTGTGTDYVITEGLPAFSVDAKPVIAMGPLGQYHTEEFLRWGCVAWQNATLNNQQGIGYALFTINASGVFTIKETKIVYGSTVGSSNPVLVVSRPTTNQTLTFGWEGTYNNNPAIYSNRAVIAASTENYTAPHYLTWQSLYTPRHVSAGSGFTKNYQPSMTQINEGVRMCWVGERTYMEEYEDESPVEGSQIEKKVIFNDPTDESSWDYYWYFGNNTNAPVIANDNDGQAEGAYLIAWSEGSSAPYPVKAVRNDLSSISTISSYNGKDIQLLNGFDSKTFETMRLSVLENSQLPYSFEQSRAMNTYFEKQASLAMGTGREGILRKGNGIMYLGIGDVTSDAVKVKFVPFAAQTQGQGIGRFNGLMRTETFGVNDNTNLTYSVMFGISDSAAVASAFGTGESVQLLVELVDETTGMVLCTSDNVTFDREHVKKYRRVGYQLSTGGLGEKQVYLRLRAIANTDVQFSVADMLASENLLQKNKVRSLQLPKEVAITNYAISQNYPNPFNPTTTINYQLPKAGKVTLRIYDMLGKEVQVLVNEYQERGRYQVEFNGAGLASGVYVYRIDCNDFHATKKLTLLK